MGLYHSDGCYYVNNVGKYSYESYCFSNTSLDIHKIFQNCCDVLEINYTKTKKMMETQIRKRESVEKLKKMIGTKKEILLYCDI